MAMITKPSARSPRLCFISVQTSGRFFHAVFLCFSLLAGIGGAIAVAMILDEVYSLGIRCRVRRYNYIVKTLRRERISSVASSSRARHAGSGGPIQAQDTGDELADEIGRASCRERVYSWV